MQINTHLWFPHLFSRTDRSLVQVCSKRKQSLLYISLSPPHETLPTQFRQLDTPSPTFNSQFGSRFTFRQANSNTCVHIWALKLSMIFTRSVGISRFCGSQQKNKIMLIDESKSFGLLIHFKYGCYSVFVCSSVVFIFWPKLVSAFQLSCCHLKN